jgi:aquaporin Z
MKSEISVQQSKEITSQKDSNLRMYFAEFLGTAILLCVGLSIVIFMFGENAPGSHLIPHYRLRQVISGFMFGSVGASIALSPLGKISGAHVNPVVTMGFRLMGKMTIATTVGYILAQLAGAIVGCLPLLLWGELGKSIDFGATSRGANYTILQCVLGEVITTFTLVAMLCFFIANRKLRKYTPFMIPVLYCIMVPLEADISGISTNPTRSLGPAVVSGQWTEWWIYWVGPIIGMLLAIILASFFALKIEEAKLYHFESDKRRFGRLKAVPANKENSKTAEKMQ